MALSKKSPSPIHLLRTAIQSKDLEAFRDAIQHIQPGAFVVSSWHECLRMVLSQDFGGDPSNYLTRLLRHGEERNDTGRRLLLNYEIERIGEFEATDFDEEPARLAEEILIEMLQLYPDLAWTAASDTGRTLFHTAAEKGSRIVIDILAEFMSGRLTPERVQTTVRTRDTNGQTALVIAVRGDHERVVEALMDLDPEQFDESNPNSPADIESAVEGGQLHILKALLQGRTRLVTPSLLYRALSDTKYDILKYLVELNPEILRDPKSNFLIAAVKRGHVRVIELLLKTFPELTDQFEFENSQGTNTARKRYILWFNADRYSTTRDGVRAQIRDLLLPVIIERNPIYRIRELLSDSLELRKEICLDLSAYSSDSEGLRRFLRLIKGDLSNKNVKELPPEGFISTIANNLSSGNISISPELETFISQVYALAANLPIDQDTMPNGQLASPTKANGSVNGMVLNTISQLFNNTARNLQLPEGSSPSFNVNFEPTLKYVELPSFDDITAKQREEGKLILDWLRRCKGVSRIFELRARDSLHLPHSEETIENALRDFNVEILDWQRADLSIDTINTVAPNVRILHLYSSGNWASLDHWTGTNGVCTLLKLERLYITIVSDNISVERAKKYREKVEERLRASQASRKLKGFQVDIRPWQSTRYSQSNDDTVTEDLRTPIQATNLKYFLPRYREMLNDSEYSDHLRSNNCRMKVAIIDSGVDRCVFTGDERDVVGASFVHNHNGAKESPWWLAGDHHGSHIAHIIAQLDPCCSLFVAKVTENKSTVGKDRVVQAIRWAIKEKVDIINMSLVLYEEDSALLAAVEEAHEAGILMFCATADEGLYRVQDIWPARYSRDYNSVFPICSSTTNGRITEYSSETLAEYTFQGEDILTNTGGTRVSGSSVATAIASGVASLILCCHRMLLCLQDPHTQISLPGASSKRTVVDKVFLRMCGEQNRPKPLLVTPSLVFPTKRDGPDGYPIAEPEDVHGWLVEKFQKELVAR